MDDDNDDFIEEEVTVNYGPSSGGYGGGVDEEDDEEETEVSDIYQTKGADDRAFVDAQAKEYDAMKKKKRDELTSLKQRRLAAQSKLSAKERALHQLELDLKKDTYIETRERVASDRAPQSEEDGLSREAHADREINEIGKMNERTQKELEYAELLRDVATLKGISDEAARTISLLEHELLRL